MYRITASRFGEVHKKIKSLNRQRGKGKVKVASLVMSFVEPAKLDNVPAVEWGKTHEVDASESFMQNEGKKHNLPKLLSCGLFIYKPHPYMEATPDSIFMCTCCTKSCVPYKCPYSIRGEDITLSWQKTQFLEFNENQIRLKRTHKYFDQILGQMAITGCTQTYFVVWTGKGLPLIEKIVFAQDHWDKIRSSVILFFKTFLQNVLDLKVYILAQ